MKIELLDQEEPAFQMAPMIDMVFLLLVFFMCASQMSQKQNLPMEIPTASRAVVPKDRPHRWVVNITEEGDLYSGDRPIKLGALATQVKARLAAVPDLKVYIRGDQRCEHRHVKKVMNRLAEVGIDSYIFGVYIPTAEQEVVPQ
ncbi:MAG: biopolymer transporter ExbD [Victivallales bacterium]|jgi:biopolymer transport protein ExbD|nr:biopolymer transporter ExbD [Victivallales bacterium]MBT7164198.1 biopolymer transporter ExbD [Victivallales bacterium]